jgi:glycosyltransferase involved in cell wall biosynthesis
MTDVKVSVIIPTYNGANKIPVLLNALLQQTYTQFEVVIVVDGSKDNTVEILKNFQNKFAACKVVVQENKGRAVVRNRGVKESSGELLIFYDDDIEPFEKSIQKHVDFHRQYEAALLTGGQREVIDESASDIHNYRVYLSDKWLAPYPESVTRLTSGNLFFTAANCSVKRSVFTMLGGFDERLTDAEDYDLAYRAMERGVAIYIDKSNKATHWEENTLPRMINRQRQYSRAIVKLSILNPDRKTQYVPSPTRTDKIFYWPFSFRLWVNVVDKGWLKYILPKLLRYKLYDMTLHSWAKIFPDKNLNS